MKILPNFKFFNYFCGTKFDENFKKKIVWFLLIKVFLIEVMINKSSVWLPSVWIILGILQGYQKRWNDKDDLNLFKIKNVFRAWM